MRIGITGAQGTGKTTLAAALAKELKLPLIKEQAREAAELLGIEKLSEIKDKPQLGMRFQWLCLKCQIEMEQHFATCGFVSDRTTIDNAVYWLKWHSHRRDSSENNLYYQEAAQNTKKYDLIVYVPPEIPLQGDGFRSTNKPYQQEIDFYIRALLSLVEPNWITVRGTLEERTGRVLDEIGEAAKWKQDYWPIRGWPRGIRLYRG